MVPTEEYITELLSAINTKRKVRSNENFFEGV
jgi:hypothetical protein